ncbi:HAD family hydrolase [Rhizosphaericola mali]|uniref:HAD hydrolase-like protein n=1 Tax=Rhizosphaericola mali TaxID=2545455 RepID=A0A5P2G797_9BACT|nr:HAD family hydrolase [Rhizosphaericola mali]QES89822.1 HAD hydrolase-like protein [Rhizosphaericola mali]
MTNIKMLVLDMAGTTVKENNLVYKTVQKAIQKEGIQVTLDNVLEHGAGKEKYTAIVDVLHACTNLNDKEIINIANNAFEYFKATLYDTYNENTINTYEGMETFFSFMQNKGIKVVLNTGYNHALATKILSILGWEEGKQIDGLITDDDVEKGRPYPDMIELAMQRFGIHDPLNVLKAGDSAIDIIEGKNSGCGLTIGVLSGAQTKEQLENAHPDYILNYVTDIKDLLFS